MSDVTVSNAPANTGAPPSAPSAPSTEVQVNEAPVASQTPLGSQAPPKPEGQENNKSSNISRREALQNAFARSKQAQEEAAKTASARPKPAAARNADGADGADAGKQPQSARPEQHREQGRFARDPNKPQPTDQTPQNRAPDQSQQRRQLPPEAQFREPPQRFSAQAKADWASAPESVRGAIYQMGREFQGAYEKYKGDFEVMETLRPWQNLATKQGTTLNNAFTNYYQMEQKLRGDVYGGLDLIVSNMGLKHPDGTPVTFRDVAWGYLNQTPEQHRLASHQNAQAASDMRIGQLLQVVEKQGQQLEQIVHKQRYDDTLDQVNKFAETHPRLDELGSIIKQELDLGFPLPVAYARAERLAGPSTQAAQTRNTSAQTRRTSISGAPDGNGNGAANTRPSDGQRRGNGEDKPHPTRREAIAKAMRSVSNRL